MNIDNYINEGQNAIDRLWTMIKHVNDILENRCHQNFRVIGDMCLLDIPVDQSFQKEEFLKCQQKAIEKTRAILQEKNLEVETALVDIIKNIQEFPIQDESIKTSTRQLNKVKHFYQDLTYQSVLSCIKTSLNVLKDRANSRQQKSYVSEIALFQVHLMLQVPRVVVSPSLDEIQQTINLVAKSIIHTTQNILDWGITEDGQERLRWD
ncbi:hypothetical protein RFI_28011 [Reticulomyxa filosa]|uniref:Uncharacterized protein n=1 Tax=Reticulomyxa filosa TaxID=46433 RepID=X6M647_RETFI|nr:hypothetical protein RFI_28011 [Reticulomyxa filosa]|eukprot:ETO09364.1 hypothetical protein RFI_28011 [Reticulomyxa filosa]